jgi:hypothetical protein
MIVERAPKDASRANMKQRRLKAHAASVREILVDRFPLAFVGPGQDKRPLGSGSVEIHPRPSYQADVSWRFELDTCGVLKSTDWK